MKQNCSTHSRQYNDRCYIVSRLYVPPSGRSTLTHWRRAHRWFYLFHSVCATRYSRNHNIFLLLLLHTHMWPEAWTHYNNLMHDGIMFQHLHGRLIAHTHIGERHTHNIHTFQFCLEFFFPSLVSIILFHFFHIHVETRDRYTKIPIRKLLWWHANFVRQTDHSDLNSHQMIFSSRFTSEFVGLLCTYL